MLVLLTTFVLLACPTRAQDAEPDPVALFEQGQDAHARGDFAAALKLYEQAIAIRPEFPEAEYQRGAALVSLKRTDEAAKAFRRALELRPGWSPPQTALARLRAGTPAGSNKLEELRRLTAAPNATAEMWADRARLEQAANDPAAATSAEQALRLDPRNLSARALRAEIFVDAGQIERAAAELRLLDEALAAAPADKITPDVKRYVASLYARSGEAARLSDPQTSLGFYRRAAELEPTNADHATGYAAALVQARRFDEAAQVLNRIIKVAPDNYAAHANLAAALDAAKRPAEALVEYEWLRAKRPELAITDFFIARSHDLLGQYAEALAEYERFVARADPAQHELEIERVKLRLPSLRRQAQRQKRK